MKRITATLAILICASCTSKRAKFLEEHHCKQVSFDPGTAMGVQLWLQTENPLWILLDEPSKTTYVCDGGVKITEEF